MNLQITEKTLTDTLKQESRWIGDSLRFETCPHCGQTHAESPAFAVDLKKQSYFSHCCGEGGHLSQLLRNMSKPIEQSCTIRDDKAKSIFARSMYSDCFLRANKMSTTAQYLLSRNIKYSTWKDLDYPLKESKIQRNGHQKIAIYPFLNSSTEIVATQSVVFDPREGKKVAKRYQGPKSTGVGLLKKADKMIVAEGLENGLGVRQFLGLEYGLIVCGDAGNLAKLSAELSWALNGCKKILIAADNDENLVGIKAARKILWSHPNITTLKVPSAIGQDWNDVLIADRMSEEWI